MQNRTKFNKYFVKKLLCIIIISFMLTPVFAVDNSHIPLKDKFSNISREYEADYYQVYEKPYYSEVLKEYEDKQHESIENKEIILEVNSIKAYSNEKIPLADNIEGKNDILIWNDDYEWFEWEVNILETGLYEIAIEYYPLPGLGSAAIRSINIDGNIPFAELGNITFPRMWRDRGEPKINNVGDEVRPSQDEVLAWGTILLTDSQGFYSEPFKFYFSEGTHRIRLNYIDQPIAIGNIILKSPEPIPTYEHVLNTYREKGYKYASSDIIKFQAESTVIEKSDPTIRRENDGEPTCEPQSAGNIKLNVIGGYRWRKGNQSIKWKFTVPEDGLYKIGMRVAQTWGDGLPVYRQITIDGKVPFKELLEYKFEYNKKWKTETIQNHITGEPYLFYLKKGEHTITMTVKMGEIGDVIQSVFYDSLTFSNLIRQIIMITGSEPDPNYEYELDDNIPELMNELSKLSKSMDYKVNTLTELSTKRPAAANNFLLIKSQLDAMVRDPDSISRRLNDLKSAQESLGDWYMSMQEQPLTIDYFLLGSPDVKFKHKKSNIIQKTFTTWRNFRISFKKDYDSIGNIYDNNEDNKNSIILNVWVSRGREWAEIMKELADEDFTPKTGIQINMNILPASQLEAGAVNALMLAIASGRAPDIACGVGAVSPVEFAIRDAVFNLAEFDDFKKVSERFLQTVMIPFKYEEGVYALPETMDFRVLFYRRDIINELRIQIPDTWEDIYNHVLPILYQNNMQFFIPVDYSPFLFQHGGKFYNENGTMSGLDTSEAYRAFKEFTEIYTSYGIPISANFYMRFRTGEMPIGMGGYGEYMMLSVAAPELIGKWGIAPIPGHKKEGGTIDRSTGGIVQQAAIILKQTNYPREAWSFLKWWTSADIQTQFGKELEALIGVEARWNTANKEAFTGLSWRKEDLDIIKYSWDWVKEMPVVLGGYFTGRHVFNAWNRVVLGDMGVRDSLEQAVEDINKELRMKQEEYGFEVID